MYKYLSNDAAKFNIAFENVSHYLVTSRSYARLWKTVNVLSPFAFGRSGKPGSAYDVDPLLLCETCTSWQYSTYRWPSTYPVNRLYHPLRNVMFNLFEVFTRIIDRMGRVARARLHGSFILVNGDASDLACLIKKFHSRNTPSCQIVASRRQTLRIIRSISGIRSELFFNYKYKLLNLTANFILPVSPRIRYSCSRSTTIEISLIEWNMTWVTRRGSQSAKIEID